MCGIAGSSINPCDEIDVVRLSRNLLRAIEVRGRHAAGAAWGDAEGVWYDKAALRGSVYAKRMPLSPLASTVALHTRWATQGSPSKNENNHPFALPGITGVHNGIILNDADIFDMLDVPRTCETDSEAIFALLAYGNMPVIEALPLLDGDAALAWIETDTPDVLHLAVTEGRPLAIGETEHGSLVFASTMQLLTNACKASAVDLTDAWDVPEWTYLQACEGHIVSLERMEAPVSAPKRGWQQSYTRSNVIDEQWWERQFENESTYLRDELGLGTTPSSKRK